MYPFYVPTKSLVLIDIKPGQYWEYREDTKVSWPDTSQDSLDEKIQAANCVAIVLDVSKKPSLIGLVVETVIMQFIRGRPASFTEEMEFVLEDFTAGHFRMLHERVQYGVYCGECKYYFPDTELKADFVCWACRNGW